MHISEDMLGRWFSGGCTEAEKRLVIEFFKNHPEKLAQYLTEENWENFQENDRLETPTHRILEAIEKKVGRVPVRRMLTVRRMAAASVLFLIGGVSLLYWPGRDTHTTAQPISSVAQVPGRPEEKMAALQTIVNKSAQAKIYSLPDGSKVELSGNSQVAFSNPFIHNRRDFFLTGEAIFTVIKDKVRPFAVHSKGIVTTALGTVFGVNDKGSLATTVHLYSGRVVIGKERQDGKVSFKNIYLLPGQELVLNNNNFSVRIETIAPKPVSLKPEILSSRKPAVLQFNRQSLADIFSILQKETKTTIEYDTAGMKNIDFTGSFDKDRETLESFLSTLCSLNELTISKTGANHFSIQKQ